MAVAFRVEELDTFGSGFERNREWVDQRKKKRTLPPSVAVVVAMRGGGRARSFRPWNFGGERERERSV